jgi:hypothetical protein
VAEMMEILGQESTLTRIKSAEQILQKANQKKESMPSS